MLAIAEDGDILGSTKASRNRRSQIASRKRSQEGKGREGKGKETETDEKGGLPEGTVVWAVELMKRRKERERERKRGDIDMLCFSLKAKDG